MADYPTEGARFYAENGKSKYSAVLEAVPEEDRAMVGLAANRLMNMVPGYRPSDAAREEVRWYERLGAEEYRRRFEEERRG